MNTIDMIRATVLCALENGDQTAKQLATATGLELKTVSNMLDSELRAPWSRTVTRMSTGHWRLVREDWRTTVRAS